LACPPSDYHFVELRLIARNPTKILTFALGAGLVVAAALGGCATKGSSEPMSIGSAPGETFSADSGSGGPGNPTGPTFTGNCPPGLKSIAVTPATATQQIMYGQMPQPVSLKATGTFADGTTTDVTSCAAWSSSASQLTAIASGTFNPMGAGQFTITALNGSVSGTAVVTVKLVGTANPGNVDATKLDGNPSGGAPNVAYPLDGALFPYQYGDLAFQVVPTASSQTLARIAFEGDAIDLKVYAPCTPIASPAIAGACSIALPPDLEKDLAGVSEAPHLTETVRLASADGSSLVEGASISARWSSMPLSGALYFWSSPPTTGGTTSQLIRQNLDMAGTPPVIYMQNQDLAPLDPSLQYYQPCFGCHAITQDGKKIALTIGGSDPQNGSQFALFDVATKQPLTSGTQKALRLKGNNSSFMGFAVFSTFSPDGMHLVQSLQGKLLSRAADATLADEGGPLFMGMAMDPALTQPFWSPKGDLLAFVGYMPSGSPAYDNGDLNGNETVGAQIYVAPVNGSSFGTPKVLVPRVSGASEYYPAISDDSALVVFNESSCAGPSSPGADGYGQNPCDGYDDPSARLRLVAASGGTPVELDRASGRSSAWPKSGTWTNSWPRWAPAHGSFQGKTLYWMAFSSRRPYGATLAGSEDGSTQPQLWFAAVVVSPDGTLSGDPSFAPVYLPQQNSALPEPVDGGVASAAPSSGPTMPKGNHIPQWVVKYVPITPVIIK
jgi:hypothetical protein